MSQKANRRTPVVIGRVLYTDDSFTGTALDGPQWAEFLETGQTFHYDGWTFRAEQRRNGRFWYAYRKIDGKLLKRYIGAPGAVTAARLSAIAHETTGD